MSETRRNNTEQPRRTGRANAAGHGSVPSGRPRSGAAANGATRVSQPVRGGGGGKKKPPAGKNAHGAGGGKNGKGGGKKQHPVLKRVLMVLFTLFCLALVVVSVLAVGVVRYLVETTRDDEQLLDLDMLSRPQTGYIWAANPDTGEWEVYQTLVGDANSTWVSLDEMSPVLLDAVISTEDRNFYEHGGFNFWRTAYAAFNQVIPVAGKNFGASTIDQQLVRNLTDDRAVTDAEGDRSAGYQRKMREIFRAVGLNNRYTKDQILEAYLNTLPLSGNIVGVQAGAYEYFNKDVGALTLTEAAMIAGITNSPTRYNPYLNPEACQGRRNDVLYFMLQNKKITQAEYEAAIAQPLGLYDGPRRQINQNTTSTGTTVNSYFSDALYEEVTQNLIDSGIVDSKAAAHRLYYNGGLHIYATVNPRVQSEMEHIYELGVGEGGLFPASVIAEAEVTDENGAITTQLFHTQSSMVVMDYEGRVVGLTGGIGKKDASLVLNRATQSPRSNGSTMKPIAAYALAIEYGLFDYSRLVSDTYVDTRTGQPPAIDPETGLAIYDWPNNYTGEPSNSPVLLCDALAQSLNTVAARLGKTVGVDTMYDFLVETLGFTTLVDSGEKNDHALSPLVLGGLTNGVTNLELTAAYAIFGNGGTYYSPVFFSKITDEYGNVLTLPTQTVSQAISPETAYIMNRLLSGTLRNPVGTARGMAPAYLDSVGKTGTTTDDRDRWFVGLTPYYVSGVWWGYDQNMQLQWSAAASTNPPPLVWKTVMEAVQEGLPEKGFPEMPSDVAQATFCQDSGDIAGPHCPSTGAGYYHANRLPETCRVHAEEQAA